MSSMPLIDLPVKVVMVLCSIVAREGVDLVIYVLSLILRVQIHNLEQLSIIYFEYKIEMYMTF